MEKEEELYIHEMENTLKGLSKEEKKSFLQNLKKNSEKIYKEHLEKICSILRNKNFFTILANLSSYCLTEGVGDYNVAHKNEPIINQVHVEIIQALILKIPDKDIKFEYTDAEDIQLLIDSIYWLKKSHHFKNFNIDLDNINSKESNITKLLNETRGNTLNVRNWGYHSQMKRLTSELYSFFDEMFLEKHGFKIDNIIAIFTGMLDIIESKLTARLKTLSDIRQVNDIDKIIDKFSKLLQLGQDEVEDIIQDIKSNNVSLENVFLYFVSIHDQNLHLNYLFSAEELSKITHISKSIVIQILDLYSLDLGSLVDYKTDHIFLNNPIWQKPVITIDKQIYFCPMPQLFFSFISKSLYNLTKSIDKDKLSKRRSSFLEKKISEIIKTRFDVEIITNLKWYIDDTEYETDLIVIFDSHLIIIEAKSAHISEPALRGAKDSLNRHINEIFIEPNIQSYRLQQKLLDLINNKSIEDELREKLPLNDIHKILRLSVSLDEFASIQSNINRLNQTGWLPEKFTPCLTITLADLEMLFDLLKYPTQILHYIERRAEIENDINYIGNELCLMGIYLENLFNFGNLQEHNPQLIISEMQNKISDYYVLKDKGLQYSKPYPKLSSYFKSILNQLHKRKCERWSEISTILYRFSISEQNEIEKQLKTQEQYVHKNWMDKELKNILVYTPAIYSEYALCIVMFKDEIKDMRYEYVQIAANHALQHDHVKKCVIICKNIDYNNKAYHMISLSVK